MAPPATANPRLSAQDLAKGQREISVAEFFAKNRHLLGYDNPAQALLTAVREAVDNSLDACEEAGILPDIDVTLVCTRQGTKAGGSEETGEDAPAPKKGARPGPQGTADRYRVVVQDNGPGFTAEQRRKLFEPFHTTKVRGTGLGLAICKRVVEAHGGRIEVGEGSAPGAEVIILLPRREA